MSDPTAQPRMRPGERGIALVVVIWTVALLAMLAMGFASQARTQLLLARNQHEQARARALADAGIALAILGVLDSSPQTNWHADGAVRTFAFGGGTIRAGLEDEAGKIDLNVAPLPLLAGLFRAVGEGPAQAASLAAAIAEWKAERAGKWADIGAPRRPGPFLAIEELRALPLMTRELYERVRPFVTVHSGRAGIDPETAPPTVLRALPGARPGEIEAFIAARAQSNDRAALPPLSGVSQFLESGKFAAATLRSEGTTAAGTVFVREAVVGFGAGLYAIYAWRGGAAGP